MYHFQIKSIYFSLDLHISIRDHNPLTSTFHNTMAIAAHHHGGHPPVIFHAPRPHAPSSWSSFTAGSCRARRRVKLVRIGCAPRTRQEEEPVVTEGKERVQLSEVIDTVDKASMHPPSLSHPDGRTQALGHDASSLVGFVVFWILAAVIFGVGLGIKDGTDKATEFFAGYLLEKSLSVDNLFVFVLIFKYFKVPTMYQGRVLSYGIVGAVIFRAIMIGLGSATLQRFEAVNILLALILLYSAYKLFVIEEEDDDLSDNFIVKTCQRFIPVTSYYDSDRFFTLQEGIRKATPLLLTVAVLELSDVAFAIDSIPAVFGVTRDPFIVFSSNMFAILGLRSLYRLISESMTELEYLQPSIGVVLGFIGTKMMLDFFGYHVSTEVSLAVVATTLGAGLTLSFVKKYD